MAEPKRLRLAPDERRKQLLDCARDIILDRGFGVLTMEAVAKEANVSNPLIYKYFDTRLDLLQQLLQREMLRFYGKTRQQLEDATELEDVVRIAVTANFDEGADGNIISILRSQPDIEAAVAGNVKELRDTLGVGDVLIERLMEAFKVSRSKAIKLAVFGAGTSQMAALHWRLYGGNRERMIKDVLQFIHAGMVSLVAAK